VVAGVHVVVAVGVSHDHRDRVRLDDEVPGQLPRLVGSGLGGRLVGVSNRDQISHGVPVDALDYFAAGLVDGQPFAPVAALDRRKNIHPGICLGAARKCGW